MNKKPTAKNNAKSNLFHFTSKMYLVTYEQSPGRIGYKKYGIVQVFNKPQAAQSCLEKLLKEQAQKPWPENYAIQYKLKTVDLTNPLTTELFEYVY